jgi:hypothetical protein
LKGYLMQEINGKPWENKGILLGGLEAGRGVKGYLPPASLEAQRAQRSENFSFPVETRPPRLSGSRWRAGGREMKTTQPCGQFFTVPIVVYINLGSIHTERVI